MGTPSRAASFRSERGAYAVGLTGGIGSGKTAVADLFAGLGPAIIDTDALAHELTGAHGAAIEPIAREFGASFIGADGALDRARMRDLVFRDRPARSRLEAILHPRIRELALARAATAAADVPYIIFVVPLLVESGSWRERIDRLLLVDCAASTQEARVCARSRLELQFVRAVIAQQASRSQRLLAADDVIVNDGPLASLPPRVQRLHRRYCEYAREHRRRL